MIWDSQTAARWHERDKATMLTAKWRMKQLVAVPPEQRTIVGWLQDVSNALIDYTKAVEYWIKQNAQVSSAAETVRLAFTIHNDSSIGYLQVLTNDAMLRRAQLALISAQQQKALAMRTLLNVLRGGS
jgi:outer membrane protein TolC